MTPSFSRRPSRRALLRAGGAGLAGLAVGLLRPRLAASGAAEVEIRMRSTPTGSRVGFDPVGLWVAPGTRVRWVIEAGVHTTTAYHPANDTHALRIPEAAEPWDSGTLIDPGATFAVTLTVPGVYDYYCAPHELAGMVGRIVVGGPDGWPFGEAPPRQPGRREVPEAAYRAFPSVTDILRQRRVGLDWTNS